MKENETWREEVWTNIKRILMERNVDPKNEGHTREWQDRARVVLDAKKSAKTEASPNQSPVPGEDVGNDEETRNKVKDDSEEPVY